MKKIAEKITSIISLTFLGIIFNLICLFIFFHLTREVLEQETRYIDLSILNYIYQLRDVNLTNAFVFISNFGENYLIYLSCLLILFLLLKRKYHELLLTSITLLITVISNTILKNLIKIPRPSISPLVTEHTYSFPSGHAMNSMVFYLLFTYIIWRLTKNKRITIFGLITASILILIIGLSRLYLGVHFPSDIVGGYIAGFSIILTMLLIDRNIKYFFHSSK